MILIADSGSTKTDWALVNTDMETTEVRTQGLNPLMLSREKMVNFLRQELLPKVTAEVEAIYFYGAGCIPEKCPEVEASLRELFPNARNIEAQSDLMGAARALCQHGEGIACILGTGANSCLFDGERIVSHVSPLGYILGDECSGAWLGRQLVNGLYKGWLSAELKSEFEQETGLRESEIIERVYREPLANRFLASLVGFIARHIGRPELQELIRRSFRLFLSRNIKPYGRQDLPLNFVGGIAFQFQELFRRFTAEEGYQIGRIEKAPIYSLIRYHLA